MRLLQQLQYELKKRLEKGWRPDSIKVPDHYITTPLQECIDLVLVTINQEIINNAYNNVTQRRSTSSTRHMHSIDLSASKWLCMQASSSTRSEMFHMIEEWKQSGLSQQAFCRGQHLRYHQFHYWYKVYRDQKGEQAGRKPSFVPVRLYRVAGAGPLLELIHAGGNRLLFYQEPSVDLLKALL
ncbi:MAG: hypothetical protein ICV84_06375 [Flavisolibacter sp.]|nr:hypothetical protein [Flavisolibacter sp.]